MMATNSISDLVRDAQPSLVRLAERWCGEDAGDLVQDTLERLARRGVPATVRCPRAWLSTMMRNLFIDRCRALARRPGHDALDETAAPGAPEPEPWIELTLDDVRAALADLDPAFRDVYALHLEGRSYDDIAQRLGIRPVTVGTRLHRARRMLRARLVARFDLD
jgi:RNA polymerase sigma-70 factor, ECF subfamily